MAPLSMSKQIISNTFNQIGKPALIINGGLFLLFAGGLIKNLMSSRTPYLPFFILPFFFAYMAYRGWGFIQMGKMIADDEAMNNYTPAPALAIFGRSREQIISKLHRNGLMTLIFGGAIFIFNILGAIAMIHTSKLSMREGKKIIKKSFYGHQGESRKGGVIFFDAFPVGNITIKPDIMNPHYQEYYSDTEGKIPPADYLNPVPIFFLTVENAEFNFYLASHKKNMALINDKKIGDKNIIEWMKDALVNHGIGAKTAVGYGYMSFT